ncbi:MAG: hypothetical protein EOO20_01950 [Chryseobacterium sp.]|nr:MAG: hypothetical protein EOO20_01950 [Chryseobacterium sp.]
MQFMNALFSHHKYRILFSLIALFCFTYFRLPVSKLFDVLFVDHILSGFESNIIEDWLIYILLGLLIFILEKNLDRSQVINLLLFSSVILITQRWNPYWNFYRSLVFPHALYIDMVYLAILLCFAIKFRNQPRSITLSANTEESFIEDLPVEDISSDFFGRGKVVQQIASVIKKTRTRKAFAIGILGPYGSGKTSFINLLTSALKDKDMLIVNFNPWGSEKSEHIQQDFFDLLAERLSLIDPDFTSLFYSYSRKLSRSNEQAAGYFKWLSIFRSEESVSSYKRINEILRRSGKKVIVTIDDLDRLYNQEVLEVLRLIRNTADFGNFFYIAAYEKHYVQSAVKSLNETASRNYLDKIFQLEIPLPKREEGSLLHLLLDKLSPILAAQHLEVLNNTIIPSGFNDIYEPSFSEVFRHARDVVKFINGFKIAYAMIGTEVDFENLFLLELLKFRYPTIYDYFYEHHQEFLYKRASFATHESFFILRSERIEKKEGLLVETITNFYKWAILQPDLDKKDARLMDTLIKRLFTGENNTFPKAKNGISYPLYFQIYFRYRLAPSDLSDRDYTYARKQHKLRDFIDQCFQKGLHHQVLTRLLQENFAIKRYEYEKLVNSIFYLGPLYIKKEGAYNFPYQALIDIISNYHNQRVDLTYSKEPQDYQNYIESLFDHALADFVFHNEIIYHLKEKSLDNFPLSYDDLVAYQVSYFSRMVSSGHGFSKSSIQLLWSIRKKVNIPFSSGGYKPSWAFEPGIGDILKAQLPLHEIDLFLKSTIKSDGKMSGMASIHNQVIALFDDPAILRDIVENHTNLNEEYRREYLSLFDRLHAVSFAHSVPLEEHSILFND